jgi:tetratricopeptide (TPR) repeat protein
MTALPIARAGELSTGAILHRIAAANESFEQATRRLLQLADLAYGQRDYEAMRELSEALAAIPFAPAQRAASYYQAVLLKRAGLFDAAALMLAPISAPRALLTLGTIEENRGNWTEAARLHVEAMSAGRDVDPFTVAGAQMQLATIRSIEGDHAGALHAFQSMWPLLRIAARSHPYLFPLWHNAVAVELGALGRADEARAAVAIALASPVADSYPEWQETAAELREPERVAVVVVEPQRTGKRQEAIFIVPLVTHHVSRINDQWSVVSGQRAAFGAPWAGLLERVKLSARDRDGPFVMPAAM